MTGIMEILIGVSMFTLVVLALVALILVAKSKLVASGNVKIIVNDEKELVVPAGDKLLGVLANQGIFVSSACGGGGTCAQCKVKIFEGGGNPSHRERAYQSPRGEGRSSAFLPGCGQAGYADCRTRRSL
jgi:Na+-transporting NADH:ubiquinone oxidoreductase subunit F